MSSVSGPSGSPQYPIGLKYVEAHIKASSAADGDKETYISVDSTAKRLLFDSERGVTEKLEPKEFTIILLMNGKGIKCLTSQASQVHEIFMKAMSSDDRNINQRDAEAREGNILAPIKPSPLGRGIGPTPLMEACDCLMARPGLGPEERKDLGELKGNMASYERNIRVMHGIERDGDPSDLKCKQKYKETNKELDGLCLKIENNIRNLSESTKTYLRDNGLESFFLKILKPDHKEVISSIIKPKSS